MNANAFTSLPSKRIFDSAVAKPAIALTNSAYQRLFRDSGFCGCSLAVTRAAFHRCKTLRMAKRAQLASTVSCAKRFSASLNDPVGNTGYTSVLPITPKIDGLLGFHHG